MPRRPAARTHHPPQTAESSDQTTRNADPPSFTSRLLGGVRLLVLSAVLLAATGAIGRTVGWVLLTTTLGPTAYLLLTHPDDQTARVRSSLLGHAAAAVCGLGCLAAFGLWSQPSIVEQRHDTMPQIGAQALAVGLTLLALAVLRAHHPPAAATALLIASGIARPGPPLYGMLTGLAILIATATVVARLPWLRKHAGQAAG